MATYYVRADGTAATKAAATNPASATTSMSMATFNAETFAPGDTVFFSARGGVFVQSLVIPSPGVSGNLITYAGEPGHLPTLAGSYNHQNGQSYIDWRDMTSDAAATTNFEFNGAGIGVVTHNLIARNSTNQCLQHLNTVQVDHYNLTTSDAADEGLSLHDSPTVRVFGGTISGFNGINWVGTGTLELYDCTIKSEDPTGYAIGPAATAYNFKAHRCVIIETVGSTKRAIDFNAAGNVEFANCAFRNLGATDYYLLLRTALTSAKVMNCVFYSGSITGAVVFNQKAGVYQNNIFHTCTSGSGKAYYAAGPDYNCYYSSGTTYTGANYITTDPLFIDPANNNFHIQAASPCRDIGADLSMYFTEDMVGLPRVAPWDIGAYEFAGVSREFAASLASSSDLSALFGASRSLSVSMASAGDLSASAAVSRGMAATLGNECNIAASIETVALAVVTFAATMANEAAASGNLAVARNMATVAASASDAAGQMALTLQLSTSVGSTSNLTAAVSKLGEIVTTLTTLHKLGNFSDPLLDRQIQAIVQAVNAIKQRLES